MTVTIQFKRKQILITKEKQLLYEGLIDSPYRSRFNDFILISDLQKKPQISIDQYRRFFKTSYEIICYQQKERTTYDMIQKSLLKGYWVIENGTDHYEIISHRSKKISVDKNGVQIAAMPEFMSDARTLIVTLDKSENLRLLLGIGIALFGSYYSTPRSLFSTGHFGPEKRTYDLQWRAKNS